MRTASQVSRVLLAVIALLVAQPALGRTVGKIIGFRADVPREAREQLLREAGFTIKAHLPLVEAVAVTMETKLLRGKGAIDRAAQALASDPRVCLVEDDGKVTIAGQLSRLGRLKAFLQQKLDGLLHRAQSPACQPRAAHASRIARLSAWIRNEVPVEDDVVPPADGLPWGIKRVHAPEAWATSTGRGVKVAVLDTGILAHPDLLQNLKGGIDCTNPDHPETWNTGHPHGTHVAGTIAANGRIKGVAPDAELYAVKVLDQNGNGSVSDLISGIDWAIDNQMNIANMSLSTSIASTFLEQAVNSAAQRGLTIVASAGNNYYSPVAYPAAYPGAHAITASDEDNKLAYFSNAGPETDNIAPGEGVLSCGGLKGYTEKSGCSMAVPHAVGVAALILQNHPALAPTAVGERLKQTARNLGLAPEDQGAGLIDAAAAVRSLDRR